MKWNTVHWALFRFIQIMVLHFTAYFLLGFTWFVCGGGYILDAAMMVVCFPLLVMKDTGISRLMSDWMALFLQSFIWTVCFFPVFLCLRWWIQRRKLSHSGN